MNRPSGKRLPRAGLNTLATDVIRLSRLLTREREGLPAAYLKDEGLRKAYVSYFLPANVAKIHTPLSELSRHPAVTTFTKEKLRILDLGSGPGTATLGILEYFSHQERKPALHFTAVDQVKENLREAEALFAVRRSDANFPAALIAIQADLERADRLIEGRFDLIVLSNVLNEIGAGDESRIEKRIGILAGVLSRFLADDGSCIVIEPALRETSRELLALRDAIIGRGGHVYSPCLGNGGCPALGNPKDWCHEEVPWEPPFLVKELDELTGLRKDSLKFSYLVLRKDRLSLADVCGQNAFRVVSERLVSKGKIEYYLCDGGVRKPATRLDKDASSLNRPFEEMSRGAVVQFEGLRDEGKRFKILKDTKIALPFFSLRSYRPCMKKGT